MSLPNSSGVRPAARAAAPPPVLPPGVRERQPGLGGAIANAVWDVSAPTPPSPRSPLTPVGVFEAIRHTAPSR